MGLLLMLFENALLDYYVKCEDFGSAKWLFELMGERNSVTWNIMIGAHLNARDVDKAVDLFRSCALHGQGRESVWLFEFLTSEGIMLNEVTFIGVLTACGHAGLVEEGCRYFRLMKFYGIKPGVEHFTCMVDLYGRASQLNKTKKFIDENGIYHMSVVWRSFLSSCRLHRNVEMAGWVSEKLLRLEPLDAGPYVFLSNICATKRRWEEAAELRSLMQRRGVKKHPGQSWIQIKNQVHTFVVGNRSHPQKDEICSYLDKLIGRLREIGYSSDSKLVMQDVREEQGEMLLGFHSGKLALVSLAHLKHQFG
ncbi:hypothetical protein CRYUN_Cryun05aG0065700 [Craigia yunnanensis]